MLPGRSLVYVALGALLIAVVTVAAPRVSGVVSWGQSLFQHDSGTAVGTAVEVKANAFHPDVEVLAATPVPTRPTAGRAPKGQQLLAVAVRLTNQGLTRWDVPLAARATLEDTLGVQHPVTRSVTAVKGGPLLPAQVKLAPGKSVTGYVVFAVPTGRTIDSVVLGLSTSADDKVTWEVRP